MLTPAALALSWLPDMGELPGSIFVAAAAIWLLTFAPSLSEQAASRGSLLLAALFLLADILLPANLGFAALFLIAGQLVSPLGAPAETQPVADRVVAPPPAPPQPKPKRKRQPAATPDDSDEHRLEGMALQARGDLDGAFAAFRQCLPGEPVHKILYKLAQEYESKKRFDRAALVFSFIAKSNPSFRDIQQRIRRAELMLEAAASSQASAEEEGRLVLGRYEVQEILGKGAMGVVYKGRDPKIGRVVAIKTMQLGRDLDPEELASIKERFFREAETAGKLTHPHIVTIYDAGEADGLAWIAMELLRGKDLNAHIKPSSLLPVTTVIEIVAQAAEGLDYAHSQGVIHRDIKPANLVYDRDLRSVKITDFGIARITDSTKTRIGLVLGTPSYMSPEQLKGRTLDGRADIFSLGITLYQLLTGQLPFRADTMQRLLDVVSNEDPPAISMLRSDLPDEMDAIVERAMGKNPDDRFQRGSDFARALRALHSEEGDLWV